MFNLRSTLVAFIGLWAILASVVNGLNIPLSNLAPATATATPTDLATQQIPGPTAAPALVDLEKRRNKFIDKRTSSSSTTPLARWLRTVHGKAEVVTPTVVGGITFGAKPTSANTPLPWISLEKNGLPKTINPKLKDGITKDASPDYGNYFKNAHTTMINLTEAGHNVGDGEELLEHVEYEDEDLSYQVLNPIIRCTPDRYFKRKKDDSSSEPFCTPQDNQYALYGQTHWVSWYSKFFPDEPIRVLLTYVNKKQKYSKRDIDHAFFISEYTDNIYGLYPLEVQEEWLMDEHEKDIILSLQYKSLPDEEVNLLNGTMITIKATKPVMKNLKKEKERLGLEEENAEDDFLYTILIIPMLMFIFFMAYAFVIFLGRGRRSWAIPKIKRRRKKDNDLYYDRLPQTNSYEHPFELKAIHRKDLD